MPKFEFEDRIKGRCCRCSSCCFSFINVPVMGLKWSDLHLPYLDKALTAQISPECDAPEWLGGIVAMLGASGLEVIAEGVETEQQALVLRKANIQMAQGFYFPASDFIAFHSDQPQHYKLRR